jgi:hypothetical protein
VLKEEEVFALHKKLLHSSPILDKKKCLPTMTTLRYDGCKITLVDASISCSVGREAGREPEAAKGSCKDFHIVPQCGFMGLVVCQRDERAS